ncbi:winged helix-turn-helix domain-containing protein [Pelagibius sp.]|uniref:winged helix-turn-helix domain-containing tetratricopeptide repeat protein n=1 Tax=Pelagibius sp. TaxID=1931238 RepID=UPI00260B6EC1|nr:winged helix-turn-helix domain-containing protein [Pelagibius sp.]
MIYGFGSYRLDTDRLELWQGEKAVAVEPQVFHLLQHLIENRERVVGKDELIEQVWGGRIVSDATLNSRINAARRAVGDSGKEQAVIRTAVRRGFRFVAEVCEADAESGIGGSSQRGTMKDAALHVMAETKSHGQTQNSEKPLSGKPSIAVLPFEDLSGASDFFSEGVAEDVVAALSKFRWFKVVSPRSSFRFRTHDHSDFGGVASDLQVRYLVDGSVRRSGERLRVVARLTDTQTAKTEWSDKFDLHQSDLFKIQDQLTRSIIAAVAPASLTAEMTRARRREGDDPEPWMAAMRAHSYLRRLTQADNARARAILMEALGENPEIAMLASDLAISNVYDVLFGWGRTREEAIEEAARFAHQAIQVDASDAMGHTALGFAAHINRDHDEAVDAFARALGLNENLAEAHGYLAMTLGFVGDLEKVMHHVDVAVQLSPYDPMLTFWYDAVAMAAYMAREFEAAADWASRSVSANPEYIGGFRVLAAACGQLKQLDLAREAVSKMCVLDPSLTCDATSRQLPFRHPADADLYTDGLRAAGLP